jgi:hypothetical protein
MKLKIVESHKRDKKYDAIFTKDDGRQKVIPFGAKGYSDYTMHHDEERKDRYLERHKDKEHWDQPMTAGALSRFILWNKPNLMESVKDFKKRFNII